MKTAQKKKAKKTVKKVKKVSTALAKVNPVVELKKVEAGAELSQIESVLIGGDLATLSKDQRFNYYVDVCKSLYLNPLTVPFGYISIDGKMTLYAKKDCTEQLRKIHGVSITSCKRTVDKDLNMVFVDVEAKDKTGKVDSSSGVLHLVDKYNKKLEGQALANAIMKCETKAKRRVTLSICGLAMPDEAEITDIAMKAKVETDIEQEIGKKLKKAQVVEEPVEPFEPPSQDEIQQLEVKRQEKIVKAFPTTIKDILKKAGFETVKKAYEEYKKVEGDLDALDQYCKEIIRENK